MKLIRLLEPLWWVLFGAGGFAAAMVLPGLLLVVCLAFPAGVFGDATTTFNRMHTLFGNPLGQLVLIAVFSLTFWHCAHHLRHLSMDLGYAEQQAVTAITSACGRASDYIYSPTYSVCTETGPTSQRDKAASALNGCYAACEYDVTGRNVRFTAEK